MEDKKRGKRTKTSKFGSPGREGHDSTTFYASKLYTNLPREKNNEYIENTIPPSNLNKIFTSSSENMEELPDNSVHLMVTYPQK
ncbi:MAG: hypothetical protein ACFFB5_23835 [Promethearchaeota archaeon]